MGKKYVMTGSFLDGFKASFTKKECILAEKHYPLGYFAVEFLEVDRTLLRELERLVPIFQEELTVFLSARDPSSAALAQQALNVVLVRPFAAPPNTDAVFTSIRMLICAFIPASCAVLLIGLSRMPHVQPLNAPLVLSNMSLA